MGIVIQATDILILLAAICLTTINPNWSVFTFLTNEPVYVFAKTVPIKKTL